MIDFETNQSQVFCNTRLSAEKCKFLEKYLLTVASSQPLYWFATSGTTAKNYHQRWVCLSRKAIMASASIVNMHMACQEEDVWLSPLPRFHVGGAAIYARAYLSGARVHSIDCWEPKSFCYQIQQQKATLTALVPAHVYDLVARQLKCPTPLRAAIVGGGSLAPDLYCSAIALGWPLMPSYGMTECSSQIATAPLYSWMNRSAGTFSIPPLQLLPHIEARTDDQSCLQLCSPALLSCYALVSAEGCTELVHPLVDGWLTTEDRVVIEGQNLKVLGRMADWVKVGGESVNLVPLQELLDSHCHQLGVSGQAVLVPWPDERLGHVLVAAVTPAVESVLSELQELFHRQILPYERIRAVHTVPLIPKTPLGKVARQLLLDAIRASKV
jgi:O-succinylbenzoic acid--CoA ligase